MLAWDEFCGGLASQVNYSAKDKCPLVRFGTFENDSRASGSRLLTLDALQADYDAGEITVAEAARRLAAVGIRAAIYTSANHQKLDPPKYNGGARFRIVAPLNAPIEEAQHETLMSLLNGAMGGVLAGESWDWSRCYYRGRVAGVPYETAVTAGECIDVVALCPDFDPIEPAERVKAVRQIDRASIVRNDDPVVAHLSAIGWETRGGTYRAIHVRCPWEDQHSTDTGPSSTSWMYATDSEPGHFACQHKSHGRKTDSEFMAAIGYNLPIDEFSVVPVAELVDLPPLERRKNGRTEATRNNLEAVLGRSDACGIRFRLDTFRDDVMVAPHGTEEWRVIRDVDYTKIATRIEYKAGGPVERFAHIPIMLVREMVRSIADRDHFDSAQFWLCGLTWDGVPRVETFLVDHLGAADTPYTRSVSRYLLTALAGRVLEPGIKADMVPVLVGKQGVGKSTIVAALAPMDDAFVELDLGKSDADQAREMRGRLVVELGELKGLRAREQDALKSFITRRVDVWVPKFFEHATNYYRRSVFVGTTNTSEFLSDDTGHRRWLPVDVAGAPAGVESARRAVAAVRDQLWAEAAEMFRAGGIEWREAEHLAKAEHARFEVTEPWQQAITEWLDDVPFETEGRNGDRPFTTEQVLTGAIKVELRSILDAQRKRVAKVLRGLGFVDRRESVAGLRATWWRREIA